MVDIDNFNGTEYMCYDGIVNNKSKVDSKLLAISNMFYHNSDLQRYLDLVLGLRDYELRIVNADRMALIKIPDGMLHRGRTNRSCYARVMFQIVVSKKLDLDICSALSVEDAEFDDESPESQKKTLLSRESTVLAGNILVSSTRAADAYYQIVKDEFCSNVTSIDMKEHAVMRNIAAACSESLPFFIVNLSTISRQLSKWKELLPRIKPFYAVKSNNDDVICRLLAHGGCGFDCASQSEIDQIKGLGVDSSQIIYANPCKQASMLQHANDVDVHLMTADSVDELIKIKQFSPKAQVLIRISVDDSKSSCKFNKKFGARESEYVSLFSAALSLGIEIAGFSYHIGSGCLQSQPFADAVFTAKCAFEAAKAYGLSPRILDVGGGFYGHDDDAFEIVASTLSNAIDFYFPSEMDIEIIAEPGRYFCAASHTYAVKVIAKKNEKVFVNDGVYGCFNCVLMDPATKIQLRSLHADMSKMLVSTTVFGPTCDSIDVIDENVDLPILSEGDWLYAKNMGAYTRTASSHFNGFGKYRVYYVWVGDQ
jgi:ornithine decarboxylase